MDEGGNAVVMSGGEILVSDNFDMISIRLDYVTNPDTPNEFSIPGRVYALNLDRAEILLNTLSEAVLALQTRIAKRKPN